MKKPIHHSITPSLLRLLALALALALAPLPLLANDAVMAKPSAAPGLPQDLFQKLGAPAGTFLDKGNRAFDVTAYGATTASSDTTAKFNDTFTAAGSKPVIFVPIGTWRLSGLNLPTNCTLQGAGRGLTILQAPDGATSSTAIIVPSTASNVTLRDLTIDGNRSHLGTIGGGVNACVFIGGKNVLLDNVEVTHSEAMGVFVGDNTISSENVSFVNCWIHDNGGTINDSGFGVGIFSGGATHPTLMTISGCLIENNYNTVTKPGDSTGLNLTVRGVIIKGNRFRNNYNVNGSQLAVTDAGDGSGFVDAVIADNEITKIGSFGTPADNTFGLEVNGRGFSITGNVINGFSSSASGINIEGAATAGQGAISGNYISNGYTGIRLYGFGDDPSSGITVSGNVVHNVTVGMELNTSNDRLTIIGNDFSDATTPWGVYPSGNITGLTNMISAFGNIPPITTGYRNEIIGSLAVRGPVLIMGDINGLTHTTSDLAVKPSCGVVATSNLTLSGAQTIDGVAGTAGQTIVLCTAQTTASQNGPWVMQSGAWTRPDWYATGNTNQAFQFITSFVRLGALYSGTTWYCTTSGTITIGTTSTTWVVTITPPAISDTAYSSLWNGVTTLAPSKNAFYDWAHTFDTDDDGKVNVLDVGAGIIKTDSSGVVSVATPGTDYVAPSSLGIRARAYNSANISVANNSLVALTFNSETDDTDTMHSTSINTGRVTATTAGYYTFCTSLEFAPNATGSRLMSFRKNGSTRFGNVSFAADTNSGATTNISTCSDYSMSAGDYVEVLVFQNSGGNLNVNRNSDWSPIFSAKRNP